jgi:hypothetical protein
MTAPNTQNFPITPSKPNFGGVSTTGSQRDRRFTDTFFDTHKHPVKFPNGRPFTGEREFTSGTDRESITAGFITSDLQCGQYFCETPEMGQTPQERIATLSSAWSAPWIPIAKYFRFNYRHKRITFAYDKMIADEQVGLARYWDAAAKLAGENDVIDPDRPLAVPFRIRTLLGSPTSYQGKIRLARAAQAGDPWLLGFVDTPNEELAKILGLNISYVGGHAGDHEHTVTQQPLELPPVVTPEQVLATPPLDIQKMIADAIAAHEAAKTQANKERMAKARAAKGKKPVAA